MSKKKFIWVLVFVLILATSLPAQIKLLHSFAGDPSDGKWPEDSLSLSGYTLYGVTRYGGENNDGAIFKINTNGTGLTLLHSLDTNTSTQELSYGIRIKPAGGAYAYISVSANTVSYIKSGLAKNKTYLWSVQAKGNGASIKDSPWPPDWKFKAVR